jgi:hypothetical protein
MPDVRRTLRRDFFVSALTRSGGRPDRFRGALGPDVRNGERFERGATPRDGASRSNEVAAHHDGRRVEVLCVVFR